MEGSDSTESKGPGKRLGVLRPQSTSWKARVTLPSPFLSCALPAATGRPNPHHRHCRSEGYVLTRPASEFVQFPPEPLRNSAVSSLPAHSQLPFSLLSGKPRKSFPLRRRFLHLSKGGHKSSSQLLFSHCSPADLPSFSAGNRGKVREITESIEEEAEDDC